MLIFCFDSFTKKLIYSCPQSEFPDFFKSGFYFQLKKELGSDLVVFIVHERDFFNFMKCNFTID